MAEFFNIDLTELEAFMHRIKELPGVYFERIDQELSDGAENIAAEAKQRAPGDTGFLRQGIGAEKISPLSYRVYSRQLYSAYVEFGTRLNVSVPPGLESFAIQYIGSPGSTILGAKEAIFAWCARKGIDKKAWYAIYITLMTKGAEPHPFFFPAVNRQLPIIKNRVLKAVTEGLYK